jgi:NAD(P)-dependent dehydrogenase (short-subunit alcohol dehydrogenase family)
MISAPSLRRLSVPVRALALSALFVVLALPAMHAMRSDATQDAKAAASARTVLVTGANRGLGLEFAKQYQNAGWKVVATARDPDAAKELKELGVRIEALDVADAASVAALAKRLKDVPVDLLINNAGMADRAPTSLQELDIDAYERVMQVNAIGPVRVTQALLPNLRAGTGKQIVSISSGLGSITNNTTGGFWGYRESKAALDMFVRNAAAELQPEEFICIAMSPGWVKTDMGGPEADITPEVSITGMRKVIEGLKLEDTSKFFNYAGATINW